MHAPLNVRDDKRRPRSGELLEHRVIDRRDPRYLERGTVLKLSTKEEPVARRFQRVPLDAPRPQRGIGGLVATNCPSCDEQDARERDHPGSTAFTTRSAQAGGIAHSRRSEKTGAEVQNASNQCVIFSAKRDDMNEFGAFKIRHWEVYGH
jgi:hypothetical protein